MENIKCLLTNFPWDLLAFLLALGTLLWWLLSRLIGDRLRNHSIELQDRINFLEGELEACRKSKVALGKVKSESIAATKTSDKKEITPKKAEVLPITDTKPLKKDDLKIVEGIGPKIEELCNQAGIFTFAQLADTSPEKLKSILEAAGPRFLMHEPATWPAQAALARDEKFNELKAWQIELNKGRN